MASEAGEWVQLDKESGGKGWAVITLAREPVNSMNTTFWQQLSDAVTACEQAPDVRGVIFTRFVVAPGHCRDWLHPRALGRAFNGTARAAPGQLSQKVFGSYSPRNVPDPGLQAQCQPVQHVPEPQAEAT